MISTKNSSSKGKKEEQPEILARNCINNSLEKMEFMASVVDEWIQLIDGIVNVDRKQKPKKLFNCKGSSRD